MSRLRQLSSSELSFVRNFLKSGLFPVGVDLASRTFQICYVDIRSGKLINKALTREQFEDFFTNSDFGKLLVGFEACGQCNYFGRIIPEFGHECKIMPAANIRALGNLKDKSDSIDASLIFRATVSPTVPVVHVKSEITQSLASVFTLRAQLTKQKVQCMNSFRSTFYEMGAVKGPGTNQILDGADEILYELEKSNSLSFDGFELIKDTYEATLRSLQEKLIKIDRYLYNFSKSNSLCCHFMTIPGVGPIVAASLFTAMNGTYESFSSARRFSAALGVVPRVTGTGGKIKNLSIRKGGALNIKPLLYMAAMAFISYTKRTCKDMSLEILIRLENSEHRQKIVLSIANRIARIAWALAKYDCDYDPSKCDFLSGLKKKDES
ncbi:MAG: IS110 family transposase [Succinivibrio sp.]